VIVETYSHRENQFASTQNSRRRTQFLQPVTKRTEVANFSPGLVMADWIGCCFSKMSQVVVNVERSDLNVMMAQFLTANAEAII
jgi:hypothetical protein